MTKRQRSNVTTGYRDYQKQPGDRVCVHAEEPTHVIVDPSGVQDHIVLNASCNVLQVSDIHDGAYIEFFPDESLALIQFMLDQGIVIKDQLDKISKTTH